MIMQEEYLWILMLVPGWLILLYLIIYKRINQYTIRKKLSYNKSLNVASQKTLQLAAGTLLSSIKMRLLRLTPIKIIRNLEQLLSLTNTEWQAGDILLLKTVFALGALLFSVILKQLGYHPLNLLVLAGSTIILITVPEIFIKKKINERRKKIRHTLPTFIDYLTISIEAGLGLDLAISRVIKKLHGPLAEEFALALTEIKYGKSKKEAFKGMSARVNVEELSNFSIALVNGEQLGVSLGNILRIQGQQLRNKKRQLIQEEAYKIPVKLVFPLVIFILPGIFIVLLGPAILHSLSIFL